MKEQIKKWIPELYLHQIKMGEGTLFYKEDEIIISVKSGSKRLSCGCPSGENIRVMKNQRVVFQVISDAEFDPSNFKVILGSYFSGKEFEQYWSKFYQKYPYLKPITISC